MKAKVIIAAAAAALMLAAVSKDHFTPIEQMRVETATPGLFAEANEFAIDFAAMRIGGFVYPTDCGQTRATDDLAVTIEAPTGSRIRAMFDGTVRLSRHMRGSGNTVVVRCDNGLETLYEGMGNRLVRPGDRVEAGQTIATVGRTAAGATPRFALMANGVRLDPATLINLDDQRLLRQTVVVAREDGGIALNVTVPDPVEEARLEALRIEQQYEDSQTPFADGNTFTIDLADINPRDWCYPLPGGKVISRYGPRGGRRHTGVDLKTRANDTIRAAFNGTVTMSQRFSAYGNCVILRHPNGLETLYSHNSRNLVAVGERVIAGQPIALTGRTGRATTEHLHFECRIGGVHFDPAKVFDHANHAIHLSQLTFTKRGGSLAIKTHQGLLAKGF